MKRTLSLLFALALVLGASLSIGQVSVDATKTGAPVLARYTWATKPAATAVPSGTVIRVTDYGTGAGLRVVSDGSVWTLDGAQVLARSGAALSLTGTASLTNMATITVPGNLLGVSGSLVLAMDTSQTNNANAKTFRASYGGTTFYGASYASSASGYVNRSIFRNRGAANSQVSAGPAISGPGVTGVTVTTAAIDSTADQSLLLSIQLGNSADTAAIEGYIVTVIP